MSSDGLGERSNQFAQVYAEYTDEVLGKRMDLFVPDEFGPGEWDSVGYMPPKHRSDNAQDLYHYLHETRMQEQRGTVTGQSEFDKLRLPFGEGDVRVGEPPAHAVLDVEPDADVETVQEAFRERARETHPDRGGSDEAFKRVKRAREAMLR